MRNKRWEEICRRCGECCRIKREYDGVLYTDPQQYCPHLEWNPDGRAHCTIYGMNDHRIIEIVGKDAVEEIICLSAEEMGRAGLLPEHCPYTKAFPNYRCRVIGYKEVQIHGVHQFREV